MTKKQRIENEAFTCAHKHDLAKHLFTIETDKTMKAALKRLMDKYDKELDKFSEILSAQ